MSGEVDFIIRLFVNNFHRGTTDEEFSSAGPRIFDLELLSGAHAA